MDKLGDRLHDQFINPDVSLAFHLDLMFSFGQVTHRFSKLRIASAMNDDGIGSRRVIQNYPECSFSAGTRGNQDPAVALACEGKRLAGFPNRGNFQQLRNQIVQLLFSRENNSCFRSCCKSI